MRGMLAIIAVMGMGTVWAAPEVLLAPIAPDSARQPDSGDRPPPPAHVRIEIEPDTAPVPAHLVETRRSDPIKTVSEKEVAHYLTDGKRSSLRKSDDRTSGEELFSGRSRSHAFGDRMRNLWDRAGDLGKNCQSDHEFDHLIGPTTNPFLFEDPRATTEIRPLLMYQKVPNNQPNFTGGNLWFVGTQARIAFTDRLSLTLNQLGFKGVSSSGSAPYGSNFGFSEIWIGPKYTFYRDADRGTILAAGATFQIPTGQDKVFQDTGSLSILPYISWGQKLAQFRTGDINMIANAGYSFSTNNKRSDYFTTSAHVDWDVANGHRFYPFLEANWIQYTSNGTSREIKGEGRDLINFGSAAKGSGLLTGAIGGRVKLTKSTELGAAYEIPMFGNRDFFSYRFTVDFIWRFR